MSCRPLLVVSILALGASASLSPAVTLVQWDFNTLDGDGTTGTTVASTGVGTLGLTGGALSGFTFGNGSTDPVPSPEDSAWTVRNFPAQGTLSGTAGLQASTSTAGLGNLVVSWDQKNQPSANKWFSLQYRTANVGAWNDVATYGIPASNAWGSFSYSIADPAAENNAQFAFRIVAVFAPGTTNYEASEAGFNPQLGNDFDMLTVSASPVPEPATLAALGLGALALLRRRRSAA